MDLNRILRGGAVIDLKFVLTASDLVVGLTANIEETSYTMSETNNRPRKSRFRQFAGKIPFLAGLTAEELNEIAGVVHEARFRKNQIILLEEDTQNYMYMIYSGKVKVMSTRVTGEEQILAIHKRGDFFGEMALLDGKTTPATVVAMEDAEVGLIERKDFQELLLSNERVLRAIISELCARLRDAWLKTKILSYGKAEQRIRWALELMSHRHGVKDQRGTLINLRLTHRDLANYTALSRETVSRHLLRLQEDDEVEVLPNRIFLLKPSFYKKLRFL